VRPAREPLFPLRLLRRHDRLESMEAKRTVNILRRLKESKLIASYTV
jgi:hypothetical protein